MSVEEKCSFITLKNIDYKDIVVLSVPPDGSCFFHAILRAFNTDYILADKETRVLIVRNFRKALALALDEIDLKTGMKIYDQLSNGQYLKFAKELCNKQYTMENLQNELLSNEWASDSYLELISEQLYIDIYILDENTGDIYPISNNFSILHKGRNSIILLYRGNHYDTLGCKNSSGDFNYFFVPTHPLIQTIRNRFIKLRNK